MAALYQLAVLGAPTKAQIHALEASIKPALERLNLRLGSEVSWEILPAEFKPYQLQPSAVVFFAGANADLANLKELLEKGIPVVPVISHSSQVSVALPECLLSFQYFDYSIEGIQAISAALLESLGLLAKQRKIFLSYCREGLGKVAAQLFERLSARHFKVFLYHDLQVPERQLSLEVWQQLCNSDVLLMLDTPAGFERRWTSAEFGRALAKGISVLSICWSGATMSPRTATASCVQLSEREVNPQSGQLEEDSLQGVCLKLEELLSQNHAVRSVNLKSKVRIAAEVNGGKLLGVGAHQMAYIQLPNRRPLKVSLTLGAPMQTASRQNESQALIYDHIGLNATCVERVVVLADQQSYPWVKATEADVHFAYWKEGV
jgi:hypothetical protein